MTVIPESPVSSLGGGATVVYRFVDREDTYCRDHTFYNDWHTPSFNYYFQNVSFSSLDSEASLTLVYPKSTNVSIQSGKQNKLDCRNLDFQGFENIQTRSITGTHNERKGRSV